MSPPKGHVGRHSQPRRRFLKSTPVRVKSCRMGVAQLVEQRSPKPQVGGSSPPAHASRWDHQLGMVPSGVLRLWCNRPTHLPPTQEIAGSSPAGRSPKFWGFMGEVPESG